MPPRLRLLTCGSVDDGKSTLIGRLLHDAGLIFSDQLDALQRDSRKHGTTGEALDFALLLDGLEAERQQGITIDVAYRYFSTPRRAFVVADTPGHEQYTRNMATGASNADLAVILVDARKGLLTQTLRHATIVSLLGIRHVVLAVNKMDLVDFQRSTFDTIVDGFRAFAAELAFQTIVAIPTSARHGDNVVRRSNRMPWYGGDPLLGYLESVEAEQGLSTKPLRMPVQWINRPHLDFRGYAGTIASGRVRTGDAILVAGSTRAARVARIVTASGDLEGACAGDAVTLVLDTELDIARGDVLADPANPPQAADQISAHLIWMHESDLLPGRSYLMKIGTRETTATVTALKHQLDVNTLDKHAARTLSLNQVGLCNLSTATPIVFDPYAENRNTGAFILIDRYSNATVAAGVISFALHRASTIPLQQTAVTAAARAAIKRQTPAIIWFTGLSGAGKSTIANLVEARLHACGVHTSMLDGDNVRHGLNRDLGFTEGDRVENIRRIGEVAKLMTEAGLIVLCSFISPFRAERRMVRELVEPGRFVEIFVDTPIAQCIARDPKGLYRRALAGEIRNFTGIDQAYEAPEAAEIHLMAGRDTPDALARQVFDELAGLGLF
jgi:bifunctional enzyme CysN/CysC